MKHPVRLADEKYLVDGDHELITSLPDATPEERDIIVKAVNEFLKPRGRKNYKVFIAHREKGEARTERFSALDGHEAYDLAAECYPGWIIIDAKVSED